MEYDPKYIDENGHLTPEGIEYYKSNGDKEGIDLVVVVENEDDPIPVGK